MATIDELKAKLAANSVTDYPDTVAGKLQKIEDAADLIGKKTEQFKITEADPYLADAALALADVENKGTVNVTLEGDKQSVSLSKGYYEGGTITVGDVSGNYALETPGAITPTKSQQNITPSEGYYGLKQVTVNAIPAAYQDVTGVTAAAADVLSGKKIVGADGSQITGSMANNGAVTGTLDATADSEGTYTKTQYTIARGYHDGTGKVSISVENKSVTPTEAQQVIIPTTGKVIGKVTVAAIDRATYLTDWTADATAEAGHILLGKTAYMNGQAVTGTMVNNTTWDAADHILTTTGDLESTVAIPAGYHDGNGVVKIVGQTKTASLTRNQQTITADTGKVLHSVIVPAIDSKYQDVTPVTATAAQVLTGSKFVDATGAVITGTMASLGNVGTTVSGLEMTSTGLTIKNVANGYTTGGTIALDSTIYDRLANI